MAARPPSSRVKATPTTGDTGWYRLDNGRTPIDDLTMLALDPRGWTVVENVRSSAAMLAVAEKLGRPVAAPGGEFVRALRPNDREFAPPGSLSANYGRGAFPLHTDTAFWPTPARLILLRVVGDLRRTTELLSFERVWERLGLKSRESASRSIWRIAVPRAAMYCSMRITSLKAVGWRYDPAVMRPANHAAHGVLRDLERVDLDGAPFSFSWSENTCLVIDNLAALHGRGTEPADEAARILFRVYVR